MKKYEVITSRYAHEDVSNIIKHYANNEFNPNLNLGIAIAERILDAIDNLQFFPMKYQELDKSTQNDTRVIRRCLVNNHAIYYTVDEDIKQVKVYRVLHQRQKPLF